MSYWEDELDEIIDLANDEGNDIDYPIDEEIIIEEPQS